MKGKSIKVDYLARVEGEGGLQVKIRGDEVKEAKLNIFEPPRFFEAFLRGRKFTEAPDITARICGICPIAYMMSSCHAMEMACGVKVEGPLRDLRRLIYCGEWIESHGLHIYMLHAPDFLGYEDAIGMAKDYPDVVKRGLKLKKIGNDLMILMGGREIHPINIRVGGFYKVPNKKELQKMVEPLKWARDASLETVKWVSTFDFPDFERDYEFVSVSHESEYPIDEGGIASNKGIDIGVEQFLDYFEEHHVKHSTSLQASVKGRGSYMTGPMARYSLNFNKLSKISKEAAKEAGLSKTCNNPFKSIIVRAVETLYACDEALRIIASCEMPDQPYIEIEPQEGVGHGATEAPRGTLYHRYQIDKNGIIKDARIIPPTSQNQSSVEEDLTEFVSKNLNLSHDELTWKCEQAVRNYDPCISCSCHFLKLTIDRE
ncbi:MAG TPA: Ni/Fe hydrogenase subunit alpha [candidate division Zixibacteria bacterium]|nr:Ni/Fe hydrogenase subunit alpha [candidate division Zixibacteria bacterium]